MLIYTDRVQVDKMLRLQKNRIDELRQENIQLKNRPSVSEVPPQTVIKVVSQKAKYSLDAPIDSWTSGHFLKYYQYKYKEKYKKNRYIQQQDWRTYALRIFDFIERHKDELTTELYKKFIDWIFKKIATSQFIPQPGNLVSDAHYYQWRDSRKKPSIFENGFTKDIPQANKDVNAITKEINDLQEKFDVQRH